MSRSPWRLTDRRADLKLGRLAAQVDVDRPQGGLNGVRFNDISLHDAALFQIGIAPLDAGISVEPSEFYVRGNDLIATYEKTPVRAQRVQIYWRALPADESAKAEGVEVVVSVQTDLLDSDPELMVESAVPAADIRRLVADGDSSFKPVSVDIEPRQQVFNVAPGCFLLREPSSATAYLEMVHPSDFRQAELAFASGDATVKSFRLRNRLFVERLEKGVILRSRLRGYFLSPDAAADAALHLYCEFAAAEPPLTA